MCEVFECDKCGWKVPATAQAVNTNCWSCIAGTQRESTITLKQLDELRRKRMMGMIDSHLRQVGL
jgi:hypothetical protein